MTSQLELVLRLLLAGALAAIIGYQRERVGKVAGLRTHVLIALGATLFTIVGIYGFGSDTDPARVATGVVTGIGFLGAGSIIMRRDAGLVSGLTTAASIWATAGIGLACGTGLYLLAAVTTVMVLVVLLVPHLMH